MTPAFWSHRPSYCDIFLPTFWLFEHANSFCMYYHHSLSFSFSFSFLGKVCNFFSWTFPKNTICEIKFLFLWMWHKIAICNSDQHKYYLQANVSLKRLQNFIDHKEIDPDNIESLDYGGSKWHFGLCLEIVCKTTKTINKILYLDHTKWESNFSPSFKDKKCTPVLVKIPSCVCISYCGHLTYSMPKGLDS